MATWSTATGQSLGGSTPNDLLCVGPLKFVMIGTAGLVQTSSDGGATWVSRTAAEANDWYGLATDGAGTVVAVSGVGVHRVMYSTDYGATWNAASAAEANNWASVTYSSALGLFIAVSTDGVHRVMTSDDGGQTWTARTHASNHPWSAIACSGSLVMALAAGDAVFMSSADGVTWADTAAQPSSWTPLAGSGSNALIYSTALDAFVSAGYNSGVVPFLTRIVYSTIGASWAYFEAAPLSDYSVALALVPANALGGLLCSLPYTNNFVTPTPTIIGESDDAGATWTAVDTGQSGVWGIAGWDNTTGLYVAWDLTPSTAVLVGAYDLTVPAEVTRCTPNHGTYVGGQSVTITGLGFTNATGAVTFGGIAALNVVIVNDTTITCTTPAHATGVVDVVVAGVGTGTGIYTYEIVTVRLPPVPVSSPVAAGGDAGLMQLAYQKWLMEAKRVIEQIPALQWGPGSIVGSPLTAVDDVNVTLSLSGSPATALLQPVEMTVGWQGVLSPQRGGTGISAIYTPGSVIFADSIGRFSQDNANFFWDATNARLGIGTNTPGVNLDVTGLTTFTQSASPSNTLIQLFATGDGIAFKNTAATMVFGVVFGGGASGIGISDGFRVCGGSGTVPLILQELGGSTVLGGLLAFSGITASFPMLVRSSAELHAKLADNSAFATFRAQVLYANQGGGGAAAGAIQIGPLSGAPQFGGIWVGQSSPSASNYSFLASSAGAGTTLFNAVSGGDIEFRLSNDARMNVSAAGVSINEASGTIPTIPFTVKNAAKTATLLTLSDKGVATFTAALTSLSGTADKAAIINPTFSLSGNSTSIASLQLPAPTVTLNAHTLTDATTLDIAGAPSAGTNLRAMWVRAGLSQFDGAVACNAGITNYNAIATAGWGLPAIYGSGRSTAQTAAVASVATYTVGAADGSFMIHANVLVTTSTTHNFTVAVDYHDETNTAQTLTLAFTLVAGGTLVTAIANANGAVPYMGLPQRIRCKASTAITVKTVAGDFTAVTYNVEASILQVS